jgi:murein DD-endopeptidase MepM/ murein hydrolase activator NlpD
VAIAATVSTAGVVSDQPVEGARPTAVAAVVAGSSPALEIRDARSQRISRTAEREPLSQPRTDERARTLSKRPAMAEPPREPVTRPEQGQHKRRATARVEKAQEERKAVRRAERRAANAARHWVLPVQHYSLSARFGEVGSLWASVHTGLDFVAAYGAPVVSVAPGVVTSTAYAGAYGYRVVVRLPDGKRLWFCHLDAVTVRVGDRLTPGDQLGTIGVSGNTTGPHLHLEVRVQDRPIDPYAALRRHGLRP